MNTKEKIQELRDKINKELLPLIDNDYVYLDLPYYYNIGDTLIWEGTLRFLAQVPYKCLYSTDINNYHYRKINERTLILLQGGGNWGDLYREHDELRKKVIEDYPQNRVIIFPQTVFYTNLECLSEDISFYSKYPNVTICARDIVSYQFFKENFTKNTILLVPDMAFFIDATKYSEGEKKGRTLYLKRTDKELRKESSTEIPAKAEVHDWPLYEKEPFKYKMANILFGILKRLFGKTKISHSVIDFKWKYLFRIWNVNTGVHFLDRYEIIYSTRLHVIILSILLHKKSISIINNSSDKNLNFYKTWLKDLENVRLHEKENEVNGIIEHFR